MSDADRDRLVRQLAEELVITEAEHAAAGLRRLTVLHDLADDQETDRAALLDFVDDVCRAHKIETAGGVASGQRPVGNHPRGTRWTRWMFAPPNAAEDLATVRAALQERYPSWPIEAEDY
ncbi:hypothetical protein ACQPXM_41260 (plasmid) [Kribbella sp. CA-253562]|uniref:hypothetical protein n=1 Tax=Kribbella sp. CA-253562 TaxID=3239942 RepID=UPI003D8F46E6